MRYLDFKTQMNSQGFFSLDDARLLDPAFNRIQLTRWQQKGYIIPIIRGWYIFANIALNEELLMLIANKLITPSYISLEFAFGLYNLIPEGVFHLTSITSKKTQQLNSELATFSYRHLKPSLMFGYYLRPTKFGYACVADLEKSLLDFLYLTPQADSIDFFEEMRFNKEVLQFLDKNKWDKYLNIFNQRALSQRAQRLLDYASY